MKRNILTLNRGDTLDFPFYIIIDELPYQMQGNDRLYFGLMDPGMKFENALIKKTYTASAENGLVNIHFNSDETVDLIPGRYYYMIKLHINHQEGSEIVNKVITLQNKKNFIIYD